MNLLSFCLPGFNLKYEPWIYPLNQPTTLGHRLNIEVNEKWSHAFVTCKQESGLENNHYHHLVFEIFITYFWSFNFHFSEIWNQSNVTLLTPKKSVLSDLSSIWPPLRSRKHAISTLHSFLLHMCQFFLPHSSGELLSQPKIFFFFSQQCLVCAQCYGFCMVISPKVSGGNGMWAFWRKLSLGFVIDLLSSTRIGKEHAAPTHVWIGSIQHKEWKEASFCRFALYALIWMEISQKCNLNKPFTSSF